MSVVCGPDTLRGRQLAGRLAGLLARSRQTEWTRQKIIQRSRAQARVTIREEHS